MRTVVSWIRCSVLAEVSCHPIRVRRATHKAATWIKTSQKRGHEFCSLMVKPLWCRVLEASSTSSRTVGPGVDTQGYRPYWTNTRTLTLESARCTVTAQLWWGNVRCCFSKILLNLRACLISTAWMHVFIYPVDRVDWWRVSLPEVLVLSRDFNVHRRLFVFFYRQVKQAHVPGQVR